MLGKPYKITVQEEEMQMVSPVPDFVFARGWHTQSASAMAESMRAMLEAQPKIGIEGFEVGETYYGDLSYDNPQAFVVLKITPSGKQVDVRFYGESRGTVRLYAGSTTGPFTQLS